VAVSYILFFQTNSLQVPIGAGLALAHKMKGEQNIAIALYGDGAADQGHIAEAMNTSALWKVPIVFLCDNNNFGVQGPHIP
jgi:pyruvate dehydrogenase E1 component alpha subunit